MILVKLVLNSIPIFFFSFFRVPKKVVERLVRLQRSFLWGDGGAEEGGVGEVGHSMPP